MSKAILLTLLLTGCAQYWVRPNTNIQQSSADLAACRTQANSGGEKLYNWKDIEEPCMMGKGYKLSTKQY